MANLTAKQLAEATEILKKAGKIKGEEGMVEKSGKQLSTKYIETAHKNIYCCPECFDGFNKEKDLRFHLKENHKREIEKTKIYFFSTKLGRLIPYNYEHARDIGMEPGNMMEYLGMWEGTDPEIIDKTTEEIRAMNLPKVPIQRLKKVKLTLGGV